MKSRRHTVASDRRLKGNKDVFDLFAPSECGTLERWQHAGRLFEWAHSGQRLVARATEENILDTLFFQQIITGEQREAGLSLKSDFLKAGLKAHLTAGYSGLRLGTTYSPDLDQRTPRQERAYKRWRDAVQAIGPMFSDAVMTVVCYDLRVSDDHLIMLQVGLINLMRWYESLLGQNINQTAARQRRIRCSRSGDDALRRGRLLH